MENTFPLRFRSLFRPLGKRLLLFPRCIVGKHFGKNVPMFVTRLVLAVNLSGPLCFEVSFKFRKERTRTVGALFCFKSLPFVVNQIKR